MARRLIQRALDSALDAIPACHDNRFVGGDVLSRSSLHLCPAMAGDRSGMVSASGITVKRLLFAGVQLSFKENAPHQLR